MSNIKQQLSVKSEDEINSFISQSWSELKKRMDGVTVHVCCQKVELDENPDHVYIYLNRIHRNGEAFRWYVNGNTPDLCDISKGVESDVYVIPGAHKNEAFVNGVMLQQENCMYIDHFKILASEYPNLSEYYKRTKNLLPTSGVSTLLLLNKLPIKECIVEGFDLYYPHYNDYKTNPQGKAPPHNESFDLDCLKLLDKTKFKIASANPNILRVFDKTVPKTDPKRMALVVITDDRFAVPTTFFINNFIDKNPWFVGDINIIHSEEISPLSDETQDFIKQTCGYRNIRFVKINPGREKYIRGVISGFVSKAGYHQRIMPSVFTVEIFNYKLWGDRYDKTLILDPDMLVLESLEDVFNTNVPILVTEDTTQAYPNPNPTKEKHFNGGFILCDHRTLKDTGVVISDHIFEFMRSYNKSPKLFEQTAMNEFFSYIAKIPSTHLLSILPRFAKDRTQILKRALTDTGMNPITGKPHAKENTFGHSFKPGIAKIVHYVGSKPWSFSKQLFEHHYTKIERVWFDAFRRFAVKTKNFINSKQLDLFLESNARIVRVGSDLKQLGPALPAEYLPRNDILDILRNETSLEAGVKFFKKISTAYIDWPALHREYAVFLLRINQNKYALEAFRHFKKAYSWNKTSAHAAAGVAKCAIVLDQKKDFLQYYKIAVKLKGHEFKAVKELKEMALIRWK